MHYDSKTIGKLMNLFKKQDILFKSRIYYQKNYNNIGIFSENIFRLLKYIRKIELCIEVPILKLIRKKY